MTVDVSTSVILLDAYLDLGRGPEAGEDLPDLPGDVHGGEDLVVHGRVRGLTDSLRVAMNSHRHEDDGQHRDGGHPDMRTLLTAHSVTLSPCLRISDLDSTDSRAQATQGPASYNALKTLVWLNCS